MQYAEIRGKCKIGKLNIKDDGAIERGFKALVDQTGVDKNVLAEELFAENEAAYILKVKKNAESTFQAKKLAEQLRKWQHKVQT